MRWGWVTSTGEWIHKVRCVILFLLSDFHLEKKSSVENVDQTNSIIYKFFPHETLVDYRDLEER